MITSALKTKLNNADSPGTFSGLGSAIDAHVSCLKASYDFTKDGGAVSTIQLRDPDGGDATLPAGAIITEVLIDVPVACTSGGAATIALDSEGAGDLLAATAVASFSLAALIDGVQDGTAATMVKTTAATPITATIAAVALTAGQFDVYIKYVK